MATQIRQIVKDAFKVNELVHQFTVIDVEDGYLKDATEAEVNEKYSDKYIVGEAVNRMDIVKDNLDFLDWAEDAEDLLQDYKQLNSFISKHA